MSTEFTDLPQPMPIETISSLPGKILDVCVSTKISATGTGWGELFRAARATSVRAASDVERQSCPCCGRPDARFIISVIWECGYEHPTGNEICDRLVFGYLTKGGDEIRFAEMTRSNPETMQ